MENGGLGIVFLYYLVYIYWIFFIDNNGGKLLNKYINYGCLDEEGGKVWIMLELGFYYFVVEEDKFYFEEL